MRTIQLFVRLWKVDLFMKKIAAALCLFLVVLQVACLAVSLSSPPSPELKREDGARRVNISMDGSWQNPAWSPDSQSLLVTNFDGGYNTEPADLYVVNASSGAARALVLEEGGNVNLPGSAWNALIGQIVFSSSREPHDEIYIIDENAAPGEERRVTDRADRMAYEPSLSPDGEWIVFESHEVDVEDNAVIVKYKIDGSTAYQNLTSTDDDCRQPNWSPAGGKILYQKFSDGQWDIWVMNTDGSDHRLITSGPGDKTDASFSPDGQWIVYSGEVSGITYANLFTISLSGEEAVRITSNYDGYDGAPSWSPDGRMIAFESSSGAPDDSSGTSLWVIDVPMWLQ